MITNQLKWMAGIAIGSSLMLASCRPAYKVVAIEAYRMPMDSTWDATPDKEVLAFLTPFQASMDSVMNEVKGEAAVSMDRYRPESPLSNLIADVLRQAAKDFTGHPADMGLINIGGIRNVLTQGPITTGNIYEILPFENSLCVLTLKGTHLRTLLKNIAARGGEGVSGVKMTINKQGELLKAQVGGQPITDDRLYRIATIDYLAEGNDGMTALTQAEDRICPEGATLRDLFMRYVEKQTAQGKKITAQTEGRIYLKE